MSKRYEYQIIDPDDYKKYQLRAKELTKKICSHVNINPYQMDYKHVIKFFEDNYNLRFIFFGYDMVKDFLQESEDYEEPEGKLSDIKYPKLVRKQNFMFTDWEFCTRVSGLTRPSPGGRTVILINQYDIPITRVIFTILHELSHVYCHINDPKVEEIYISLSDRYTIGDYPVEIVPFENEANTVASFLYVSDDYLEHSILNKRRFQEIAVEKNISDSALHNRILSYLYYNLKLPYRLALNLVLNYRNQILGNDASIKLKNTVTSRLAMQHLEQKREEKILAERHLKQYYEEYNPYRLYDD